jgi:hypothetical protein
MNTFYIINEFDLVLIQSVVPVNYLDIFHSLSVCIAVYHHHISLIIVAMKL